MDRSSFLRDEKTQAAVRHEIMIIGEAANRTSSAFRLRHADVPWPIIVGMRNKLVHEYDEVDLHEVWKTTQTDLPELIDRLAPVVPEPG